MTLYEINKQAYNKLPDMSAQETHAKRDLVEEFLKTHPAEYYMCLNNENRYYTIYTHNNNDDRNYKKMAYEIIEIMAELGGIKDIDLTPSGDAVEFWVNYENIDVCVCYLFPYDKGVVKV